MLSVPTDETRPAAAASRNREEHSVNLLFDALLEFLGSLMAGSVFAVGGWSLKKTRNEPAPGRNGTVCSEVASAAVSAFWQPLAISSADLSLPHAVKAANSRAPRRWLLYGCA
jgi:hypothetical protein